MATDLNKKKLQEFLKALDNSLSKAEFENAFERVLAFVSKTREDLIKNIESRLGVASAELNTELVQFRAESARVIEGMMQIKEQFDARSAELIAEAEGQNRSTFALLRERAVTAMNTLFDRLRVQNRMDDLVNELNAKIAAVPDVTELAQSAAELMPKMSAVECRDKLEELTGDERLSASAIKDLPDLVEKTTRIIGNTGPLYSLIDVDVAGVTTGQSIKWDGVRWIPYTPAGGANTPVYEEAPTDSGDHTNFTLAHTPASGTLRLYRSGSRITTGAGDYTLAAGTITLTNALATGETLYADYEY